MIGWSSGVIDLGLLAPAELTPLTESELKLLCAVVSGQTADYSAGTSEPFHNDPHFADFWSQDRDVRPELIRWLCLDRDAVRRVDPRGLVIHAARINGELDLAFSMVPFPLRLLSCRTDRINVRFAKIEFLELSASRCRDVCADGTVVRGDVNLGDGFSAEGEVSLLGANIGGNLDCAGGTFVNRGGRALSADGAKVMGDVSLCNGFNAEGEVRVLGAHIEGDLDCIAGKFVNANGCALNADRANVTGSVFLRRGFSAEGEVRLHVAHIGGNFDCAAGAFVSPGRRALSADGAKVTGSVFFRDGFNAKGQVGLPFMDIGLILDCSAGKFVERGGDELSALRADGVKVRGSVFLSRGFSVEGEVRLHSADIGGDLNCEGAKFATDSRFLAKRMTVRGGFFWRSLEPHTQVTVSLIDTCTGPIFDDSKSWPESGHLALDGFAYARIAGGTTNAKHRLDWLHLQTVEEPPWVRRVAHAALYGGHTVSWEPKDWPGFRPQPHQQLARVLREAGDNVGARRVLIDMENRLRKYGNLKFLAWLWRWILRVTIGYGYRPWYALFWVTFCVALGSALCSHYTALITPSDRETYSEMHFAVDSCIARTPKYYQPFSPIVFSLDTFLPIINLGQKDHWMPNPNCGSRLVPRWAWITSVTFGWLNSDWLTSGWLLRLYLWFHILFGWLLTTLVVAGLTPIIRSG
jgi:sRNA-binding regulator protein Hfq